VESINSKQVAVPALVYTTHFVHMEDLKDKTASLANHVEDIANTFYKLTIVNITQKASRLSAGIIVLLGACLLGFFAILFTGLALAWWLGDIINNRAAGFLLAGALDIILLFVFIAMKKKVIFPYIRDLIIRKIYDDED
jgi:hypothetical protein